MKKLIVLTIMAVSCWSLSALSGQLDDHFFGVEPLCISKTPIPVLIIADVTRSGEIDDSLSLAMYSRLEDMRCVKVIGVVSIFGNGGATTAEVHRNLLVRLQQLELTSWQVFIGPSKRVSFESDTAFDAPDKESLTRIAAHIKVHGKVVISELGPFTISASLLKAGFISEANVIKILGVGGRAQSEQFSQNPFIPFSFRDMNVAEDRAAMMYLLNFHPSKLWTVTYRTGIGARMIRPEIVSEIGSEQLTAHAYKRARMLKKIGYDGKIPAWDTWTTSWFLKGGADNIGCRAMWAQMAHAQSGFKSTDSMQLRLFANARKYARKIESCHEKLE